MDINDLHVWVTVASLAVFVAIAAYSWSRRRQNEYEAAQLLPFLGDDAPHLDAGEKQ